VAPEPVGSVGLLRAAWPLLIDLDAQLPACSRVSTIGEDGHAKPANSIE